MVHCSKHHPAAEVHSRAAPEPTVRWDGTRSDWIRLSETGWNRGSSRDCFYQRFIYCCCSSSRRRRIHSVSHICVRLHHASTALRSHPASLFTHVSVHFHSERYVSRAALFVERTSLRGSCRVSGTDINNCRRLIGRGHGAPSAYVMRKRSERDE